MVTLPGSILEWRGVLMILGLAVIYQHHYKVGYFESNTEYLIIAVSGGLQHGFPEHDKLDYTGTKPPTKAIYLGRALVRGYRGYLDVMSPTHRQYVSEPARINSNVFATGCQEHANEYWVYAVDVRQAMMILANEPRFLSITPDTGLVDVQPSSSGYTTDLVRDLMLHEIRAQNKSDTTVVALPLVTAVWFDGESHLPSPIIDVLKDGTEITNFPQSLAKWAGVEPLDSQLPVVGELSTVCSEDDEGGTCPLSDAVGYHATVGPEKSYWDSIRNKIKAAEINRPTVEEAEEHAPSSWKCKNRARFGVSPDMARVNYPFKAKRLEEVLREVGYDIDFRSGEVMATKV
mmetsp:Transcript_13451/g.29785  ORF Transcript_13451/g.29785 Transcript_13451/m.29785 type:complete len:346 (+) Transcript_13451:260-1297(+)